MTFTFHVHIHHEEAIMANIAEIKALVARVAGNTDNVQRALGELNDKNATLIQQVADLQAQLANGTPVTDADLQEIADGLVAADEAMDTIAPEAPNLPNEPA